MYHTHRVLRVTPTKSGAKRSAKTRVTIDRLLQLDPSRVLPATALDTSVGSSHQHGVVVWCGLDQAISDAQGALQGPKRIDELGRQKPGEEKVAVERALFGDDPSGRPRVRGASRKWRLIRADGEIELLGPSRRALRRHAATGQFGPGQRLWVQRADLSLEQARDLVLATTLHGNVPEPLPLAHLIAGGIVAGKSHGRA